MSLFQLLHFLITASVSRKLTREDEQRWRGLLVQASEGQQPSYEQLLREMSEYLNGFCSRHLYSREQAEDCVQECLVALHKAKHTYDPSKPFGPWFFTIVRRKVIDQYRKAKQQQKREVLDQDLERYPGTEASTGDLAIEVERLLPKLDPIYRETFRLTHLENKTIAETAKMLNIGESAAKVRAHRAGKALRRLIEQEFAKR